MIKKGDSGMTFLNIDKKKCKKDGLCVAECPVSIIHQKDKESFPEIVAGGEQICLLCGHCVAICPHSALSHERIPIEACRPIDKDLVINENQAIQFLRSRRSVRFFKDKPVEKETLQNLIEIARYAPTGGNSQLVEWTVLNDKEKIHDIAGLTVEGMRQMLANDPDGNFPPYFPLIIAAWDFGLDVVLRDAPALVIASAPAAAVGGMTDVSLALSYLELAAQTSGIGTCWAGVIHMGLQASQPLKDALGLPKGHVHHYAMMLGYAKPRYFKLPERKMPKIHWR
jgi:nitroreductase/NAD-dependent dihydropyrimidine dehydrogenase PreA subunit